MFVLNFYHSFFLFRLSSISLFSLFQFRFSFSNPCHSHFNRIFPALISLFSDLFFYKFRFFFLFHSFLFSFQFSLKFVFHLFAFYSTFFHFSPITCFPFPLDRAYNINSFLMRELVDHFPYIYSFFCVFSFFLISSPPLFSLSPLFLFHSVFQLLFNFFKC